MAVTANLAIHSSSSRGQFAISMASPLLAHPFYVVPVKTVIQMGGLRPHEEVREQLAARQGKER